MIFVVSGVFGQKTEPLKYKFLSTTFKKIDCNFNNYVDTINYYKDCRGVVNKFQKYYRKPKIDSLPAIPISFINSSPINVIAANYYTQNLGFFCKKELQLQKAIKVPFMFRLGSVEMCDRLEGK